MENSEFGCELLSNEYLCASRNNPWAVLREQIKVVNCFQMSIFALAETTQVQFGEKENGL